MKQQIVFTICGNTPFDSNPLGARLLAEELSKTFDVLYVEPPLSHLTAYKKPELKKSLPKEKLRTIKPRLHILTPVVLPGKDRLLIHRATSRILSAQIAKALRKLKLSAPIVGITTAPHYVLEESLFDKTIYWMMDDYLAEPSLIGVNRFIVSRGIKRNLQTADRVVVVSKHLEQKLGEVNIASHVINNGADSERFMFPVKPRSALFKNIRPNSSLYVGGINDRLDIECLLAIARDGIDLVIAGRRASGFETEKCNELVSRKNVVYLGDVAFDEIPELMNHCKVGLVPYRDSAFNRSSMPLKISEYLLCGMTVVSTDLDFVNEFEKNVFAANNYEAFAQRTADQLSKDLPAGKRVMRANAAAQKYTLKIQAEKFVQLTEDLF